MEGSTKATPTQNASSGNDRKTVVINGRKITLAPEILELINGPAKLQAVKAVQDRYDLDLKDAKEVVEQIQGVAPGASSGKGCMITLLIVLSTSISALFFL